MIYGHINHLKDFPMLTNHSVWQRAFSTIQALPKTPDLGIKEIMGKDIYINVMKYDTVSAEESRFESHRKYVDLQCTLLGAECIEWNLTKDLEPTGVFDEVKDIQFYKSSSPKASLQMHLGYFAIFFPGDGHRPKVKLDNHPSVFKLVIKINLEFLK